MVVIAQVMVALVIAAFSFAIGRFYSRGAQVRANAKLTIARNALYFASRRLSTYTSEEATKLKADIDAELHKVFLT